MKLKTMVHLEALLKSEIAQKEKQLEKVRERINREQEKNGSIWYSTPELVKWSNSKARREDELDELREMLWDVENIRIM